MVDTGDFDIAVELRGWSERGIKRFVRELGIIDVTDPLVRTPFHGAVRYYRLHGRYENGRIVYRHSYSEGELEKVKINIREWNSSESFVFFNNSDMCRDAKRFRLFLGSDTGPAHHHQPG